VRKAVNDLIKYGSVQRGYIGIQYLDLRNASEEDLKNLGLTNNDGVYVAAVTENSGAMKAGLQKGDIITEINGVAIHTEPDLQGEVARYQPGDNISVSYLRNGKLNHTTVLLKNAVGSTEVVKTSTTVTAYGAEFRELTTDERIKYDISQGVVLNDVGNGPLSKQTDIRKGFIVFSVNGVNIRSLADLQKATVNTTGSLRLAGTYPGGSGMYYYSLRNNDSNAGTE
jgi:S1-C subfamily serine protease